MKRYENLQEAMCRELEKLDKKYSGDTGEMSAQDAEKADLLYHALKSAATYHAMKDVEGWEGGRGHDRGRYSGRDMDERGRYPDWQNGYYR